MEKKEELVNLLIKQNKHITFAESCTGGLMAATLVDVADASKVFDGSFVTYANEVKHQQVHVKEATLEIYGAVSEETAQEMAQGCAQEMQANIGVGISGIAGPTGGTIDKPIGTVCFGFVIDGEVFSYTKHFGAIGRTQVRLASVDFVLDVLLARLREA